MSTEKQKWMMLTVALVLIGGTAGLLARQRSHQRLGLPGVKTRALPGSRNVEVDLPERVLDYQSQWVPVDEVTSNTLPRDTSFGERVYQRPDGFQLALNVVLMGADRTSLHKPQFCLEGQGLHIDQSASQPDQIRVDRPQGYDLPVVKLVANGERELNGQKQPIRAIYVYWYVADNALSATISGFERMWLMGKHLLSTGELQRWAYISCLSECLPGQEEATYERMKQFIAASAPEFQLTPKPTLQLRASTP
jgi:hypothetical protein